MVIADDTVDAELVATNLPGQAEHGHTCLIITSRGLATGTLAEVDRLPKIRPGEGILCDTRDKLLRVADAMVCEPLQPWRAVAWPPHEHGIVTAPVAMTHDPTARFGAVGIAVVLCNRDQQDPHLSEVTAQPCKRAARGQSPRGGGHRRIAHIAGWQGFSTGRDPAEGFRQGLATPWAGAHSRDPRHVVPRYRSPGDARPVPWPRGLHPPLPPAPP